MAAGIEIEFDTGSVDLFQEAFEQAPEVFLNELATAADEEVEVLRRPMAEYPAAPSYPIQWDSDKQRKAFFATDGFGGGIPHARSGALPQSWQTKVMVEAASVIGRAFTNFPGARYVQDRNMQSRIHAGRWITVQDDLAENYSQVVTRFRQAALTTLGRIADTVRSGYSRSGD